MSGLLKFAGKHVVFEGLHYLPNPLMLLSMYTSGVH